jgi:hypothetical protein
MKREADLLIPFRLISLGIGSHHNLPGDAIANEEITSGDPDVLERIAIATSTCCDEPSGGKRESAQDKGIRKHHENTERKKSMISFNRIHEFYRGSVVH